MFSLSLFPKLPKFFHLQVFVHTWLACSTPPMHPLHPRHSHFLVQVSLPQVGSTAVGSLERKVRKLAAIQAKTSLAPAAARGFLLQRHLLRKAPCGNFYVNLTGPWGVQHLSRQTE